MLSALVFQKEWTRLQTSAPAVLAGMRMDAAQVFALQKDCKELTKELGSIHGCRVAPRTQVGQDGADLR